MKKKKTSHPPLFPASIDWCHLTPQTDYLWDEQGERTCSYILRFEHLESDFAALAALYGKDATVNVTVVGTGGGGGGGSGNNTATTTATTTSVLNVVAQHRSSDASTGHAKNARVGAAGTGSYNNHPHSSSFTVDDIETATKDHLAALYAADYALLGYRATDASRPPPPLLAGRLVVGGSSDSSSARRRDGQRAEDSSGGEQAPLPSFLDCAHMRDPGIALADLQ